MNMNFKKKLIIVIYNLIIGSDDIKNGLYTNFKVHIDFLSKNEYFLCVALLITWNTNESTINVNLFQSYSANTAKWGYSVRHS